MIEPIQAVSTYKGEVIDYYTVKNFCRQQYEKDDVFGCINFYNINDAINFINSKINNDMFIKLELTHLDKMFNILYKYEMKADNRYNNYSVIWQLSKEEITIYKGDY